VVLFPGLAVHEGSAELRRFPSRAEAEHSHRAAVRLLLELCADGSDHLLAWLSRDLQLPVDLALPLSSWTDARVFTQGLGESLRSWALDAGCKWESPRDIHGFHRGLEEARTRIRAGRGEARDRVRTLVSARKAFEDAVKAVPSHRPDLLKFAELTRARLWSAGFPGAVSWPVLGRLPTWWNTAARRLRSAVENPMRDQERAAELQPLVQGLAKAAGSQPVHWRLPGTLSDPDGRDRLCELAFCLEEFRVQTWAQDLGTAIPASRKRIQELFDQAGVATG